METSLQIRVVSQEVRLNASQLDELYNLFKVSTRCQHDKMSAVVRGK